MIQIKVIGGGEYRYRATPFHSKFCISILVDLATSEKTIFVFKYGLKALPAQFTGYFTKVNNVCK